MRPDEWFSRRRTGRPSAETASATTDEALRALDAVIRQHGHDGLDGESMRVLVAAYCAHARGEHLSPEHMLVQLKAALNESLIAVVHDPMRRDAMRVSVVKLAIDAYYDERK